MSKPNTGHAELSASGSEIWLNCPGAPSLIRKAPPQRESPYAIEGTRAHEVLQKWLTHLRDKAGAFVFPKNTNAGTIAALRVCVDDLKQSWRPRMKGKTLHIEKKVSLAKLIAPDMFGTVDIGVTQDFGTLEITDYKHGSGVKVEIMKESASGHRTLNTQLVYYALGLADEYDFNFDDVVLKIVQPRCAQGTPKSSIRIPMRELKSYIPLFKKGVERTMRSDAKRFAGPWCRFCKAKPICKEGKTGYRTDCREDFT